MEIIGVIPARYSSTRFEGKVLADIAGKPMIRHVWERAKESQVLEDLIIACDDERIAAACEKFGARAVMTVKGHTCGTDRIIEVVNPLDVKIVINIQADEPLIRGQMIDAVGRAMLEDRSVEMATLMKKIEQPAEINDPNIVKVVTDKNGFALYFSRSPIPYSSGQEQNGGAYYKHIGLYGYTKDFLFIYKNLPLSRLEKIERLEQLRVLEEGLRIKVIETSYDTVGVDTPQDLERVRQICASSK